MAGFDRIIGFDMGGTSTDVTHYAGTFERAFETHVAGVRMRAPMMKIHTVAAGGGSILRFDGAKYRVGPESAGANPGPACYRRGGPLTVTDCNVMLASCSRNTSPGVRSGRRRTAGCGNRTCKVRGAVGRDFHGDRRPARAGGGRRRLPAHRRRQYGQRDQAGVDRARLRRHRLYPGLLRWRRRPARVSGGRCPGHEAGAHPSLRRRAVRLWHGAGRGTGDARAYH